MFDIIGKIRPQIETRSWAGLGHPGQTLQDLERILLEAGNRILEIDEANQRILIAQAHETGEDVWGCRLCLASGQGIVIVDSETELIAHCDEEHPGWRA